MYKKILVPLDGSKLAEQILPYTGLFATVYGSTIELLHIRDPDARPPFWPPLPSKEYLRDIATRYFAPSTEIDCFTEEGSPAALIVDRAKSDPACLIAMATHGVSGLRRWLLGSVTSKVIQTAANPVLLIRPVEGQPPTPDTELKTLVVPLDGSAMAEKILPHVVILAKKFRARVELVRVYTLPLDSYVIGDGVYGGDLLARKEALRNEVAHYLNEAVEKLREQGVDSVAGMALEGDPSEEIIDLARRTPNNLIAMCTHGRSGVGRWVLGSVAERIVQHAQDPVLLVRVM